MVRGISQDKLLHINYDSETFMVNERINIYVVGYNKLKMM